MPLTCIIDHDQRYIKTTASGFISWQNVRDHLLSERFAGGLSYKELIDARNASPIWSSVQTRDIVALFNFLGRESSLGSSAVVVSGELATGMMNMLAIMLGHICKVKIFHDCAAAEKWLLEIGEPNTVNSEAEVRRAEHL